MKQISFILFFTLLISTSIKAQSTISKLDDKAALEVAIQNNKKVVVFFAAEWCDYCNDFLPKVEEITTNYEGVKFFKINYDENIALFEDQNIEATPTTILYKNGIKVDKMVVIETMPLKEKLNNL